jgi:hypothetical protein
MPLTYGVTQTDAYKTTPTIKPANAPMIVPLILLNDAKVIPNCTLLS